MRKANRTRSSQQTARLEIESFEGGIDFSETLTCTNFEKINIDLFRKTLKPVEQVFQDASVKKEDSGCEFRYRVPSFPNARRLTSVLRSFPLVSTPTKLLPTAPYRHLSYSRNRNYWRSLHRAHSRNTVAPIRCRRPFLPSPPLTVSEHSLALLSLLNPARRTYHSSSRST